MKFRWAIISFILSISYSVSAQTHSYSGWLVLSHIQKLNDKISMNMDAQFRSLDQFKGIRTVLIRPGLNYTFKKNWSAGIGYAFINSKVTNKTLPKSHLTENMIWEQLQTSHKIGFLNLITRARLEQRFTERQTSEVFSQRFRFFNKLSIPLAKDKSLSDGLYFILQDEILLNVQNKDDLNHHNFDQNRAFVGFGHSFNKHFAIESGYHQINIKGISSSSTSHIAQLSLLSKFGS